MWMTVWKPLIVLIGLGGLSEAGAVTAVVSANPAASDAVTAFGIFLLTMQAVVSVGLLVAGVWGPVKRLVGVITGHAAT